MSKPFRVNKYEVCDVGGDDGLAGRIPIHWAAEVVGHLASEVADIADALAQLQFSPVLCLFLLSNFSPSTITLTL